MTKAEAIDALHQGCKVTHESFADNEWIQGEGLMLTSETGFVVSIVEFMRYKSQPVFDNAFEDGWSMWEKTCAEPNTKHEVSSKYEFLKSKSGLHHVLIIQPYYVDAIGSIYEAHGKNPIGDYWVLTEIDENPFDDHFVERRMDEAERLDSLSETEAADG